MNELKSYTEYTVSTPTADFVIGFDFNYGEDAVNVTVNDVPATEAGYTVVYLNETTIRLSPSVPSGVVRLQRETDIDQTDHAYRAGAKFIAQTMDENFEQLRHSQQEVRDGFVKLAGDTHEIIDGLDAALELAQDAASDAQEAAVIAQGAADTVNTIIVEGKVGAGNVLDASGETQQEINDNQQQWNNGLSSIADMLAIENPTDGSRVFVKSYYAGNNKGAHDRIYDSSRSSENSITCINGWVVQNPSLSQCGAYLDGESDDSQVFQDYITYKQNLSLSLTDPYNGMHTPQSIEIDGTLYITKTINVRGDLVRFSGKNGASIIVDKDGTYTNNFAFNIGGTSAYAAYSAQTGALFKDILFKSADKIVDLFYSGTTAETGGNGGVELKNIVRCSFFGFRRIFTNGVSGWGWNWLQCQFCLNTNLLYLVNAADTGERQTFTGCIWQNGGYAFNFAGGFTPIYWYGGSFDYCLGIIDETSATGVNGAIFLDSHFEWIADATYTPCIRLQSSGIRVILSGNMTLGNSSAVMYHIFQQVANNQIKFDNLLLAGGVGWSDYISLDNAYAVDTHGVILPSDSDGSVLAASKCTQLSIFDMVNVKTFAEVTLTNTTEHRYNFSASGLVFSSTGGAGANGSAHIDIPLCSQISTIFGLMSVLNNSIGSIGFTYSILDKNKSQVYQITDYAQNSVSKSAIAQSVPIGIRKGMPFGAFYLRISANLFNVSATDNLTISQIKLFMQ